MFQNYTALCLTAAMLLSPVSAAVQENPVHITLQPPAAMASSSSIGTLTVCCDGSMKGTIFELHLYQQEGDLLYYKFTANDSRASEIECPLMKDGDYMLIVRVPQPDSPEASPYLYPFSAKDPDPADYPSDFDKTELTMHFCVDPTLAADTAEGNEPVLKDRIYTGSYFYSYARKAFSTGDANSDGVINANDATRILSGAAALGVGRTSGLSSLEAAESDVDGDGVMNAKDATWILAYAAAIGVKTFDGNLDAFVQSRDMQ